MFFAFSGVGVLLRMAPGVWVSTASTQRVDAHALADAPSLAAPLGGTSGRRGPPLVRAACSSARVSGMHGCFTAFMRLKVWI